ncbi:MAG: Ig-like domain-containing protein [Ruminococcus sp.]|nr:Ig-like domain-containing protein [Ruminococcus sp.]
MKNSWKKTAAFVLAFTLVAAPLTQAGKGGLFGGSAITAKAAPPSESDPGVHIGNVTVDKTETLLTTITPTGKTTYSETTSGVVSVTPTNVTSYSAKYGWLWFDEGSLSVTAEEGYTITKCVFIQNAKTPITDTEAPFEIHSDMGRITEDKTWDMDGVTSIEVYGYATTTAVTGVALNKNETNLTVGGDETLSATVSPTDATDKTVTWSSSNTDVATVDANGKVSAVGAGSATIKATATNGTEDTSDDKEDYCTVIVKYPFTAKSITIDDFTYDGKEKTPVLKYGNTVLREGTDYVLDVKEGDIASATDAGTYTIHINGKGDYAGENIALTWKINKADVNVTADAKSKKYGEDDPVLTYTAGALFGTDAFTGALARAEGEAVNTYAITQGTLSAGDNYNINFTGADFTINKADSTPDAVTGLTAAYGKTLADVTLPDGWAWDAPDTSVGDVGENTFSATFTPTDTANYNPLTTDLTVNVTAVPAAPTAVGTLNATYGDTLADVELPKPEDGTWAWKDDTTSVGNAGEQTFKAVFTPSSPNYTAVEQDVTINVAKADPTPDAVTGLTVAYGKKLSDVTLPDGWAWDAPATSVGNVGNNPFAATYTPTDTDNYNTLNQNLTVNVVAVDKTSLNEAIAAANTYLATIKKTVYADPALALDSAITDAKAVAENDNVTEEAVAQAITDVNNAVTTAKAAVKDIDDTKAAQAVTDKINALPAVENIKSTDKEAVEAARAAYANLKEAQAAKVETATTDKLTAAEKAVADHIAADAVIAKIDAIREVVLTNENKALIDAARTAYEALATDTQKALVSNYTTLTADEQKYSELQVDDVKAKIDAIGDIELTDKSKAAIDTARAAFKALNADQQALVANAKVLDYAEKLYDALEDKKTAETDKAAAQKAATDAKAAQTKAEEDTTTAKAAQAKAEEEATKAKAAQTKAEEEATKAKTAQANAEKAQATAEKAAADAKTAQTKAEEEAAAAKTAQANAEKAQATAEKAAADAKTAQTKAEEDAAAAKAAQATAEKAAADAKTAQTKAEEDAAAAKAAQATAEKAAADAKTAQTKAEEDAAVAKTAQATAEKNAEAANSKVSDLTKQLAAAVKQIEELESSGNVDEALKKQVAELKEQLDAAKTAQNEANEALAKAQDVAAAKIAAAEAAQEKAEEEATAAEKAQATAEQTAKEATEKAAAAEKAQATAEQNAKEATEKAAAAEEAQKVAEAAQAEAEKKAAEDKAAADQAAADKVIKLIDAIGNVEKTNTSENKIVAARAAYDALTDEQKALVTNYTVLTKAESAYKTLPQTGMSGFHKVFAGLAALMGITGMGLIKKSRKEDEEE